MKTANLYLCLLVVLITTACKKHEHPKPEANCKLQNENCSFKYTANAYFPEEFKKDIIGIWYWNKTTGSLRGGSTTPATTGHTEVLEFKADGTVNRYTDCKLVKTMAYEVRIDENLVAHLYLAENPTEGLQEAGSLYIQNSCMKYGDEAVDGEERYYSREQCTCPQ